MDKAFIIKLIMVSCMAAAVLCMAVAVNIYFGGNSNGRYQLSTAQKIGVIILDTRTGKAKQFSGDEVAFYDYNSLKAVLSNLEWDEFGYTD
ncbi:MAG: hypothetical protein M0036_18945 [Desulfobacteraceae bacterium]|nr:hypothetical protein [Desulfobacteraceae bacterium]